MAKANNLDDAPVMRMPKEITLGPVVIPSVWVRLIGLAVVLALIVAVSRLAVVLAG